MERDKLGRFIKKFNGGNPIILENPTDGSFITLNGSKYRINSGANAAYNTYKTNLNSGQTPDDFNTWLFNNNYLTSVYYDPDQNILTYGDKEYDVDYTAKYDYDTGSKNQSYDEWLVDSLNGSNNYLTDLGSNDPKYYTKNKYLKLSKDSIIKLNGEKYKVKDGMTDALKNAATNQDFDFEKWALGDGQDYFEKINVGVPERHSLKDKVFENLKNGSINKEKLANWLELSRIGINNSFNKKIIENSINAEKPLLQSAPESHRSIYGDYRSKLEKEKQAAQLRNLASTPLTSDGALQQQIMMEAQLKGNEYINQGNAQDEAMIKQTREAAWAQEKENQQLNQAAAMQNRQALLMSEKNKTELRNQYLSGVGQDIDLFMKGNEQRIRNEAVQQKAIQDKYNEIYLPKDVWNNYTFSSEEFGENATKYNELKNLYLTENVAGINKAISDGTYTTEDWTNVQQVIKDEILKKQASLYNASVMSQYPTSNMNYGYFSNTGSLFQKKGGTIYKAKLTKRTRDNDRAAKSIESNKKIAARFLEKAIDSLYTYKDVELIAKTVAKKRKYQAGGSAPLIRFSPVFATSERDVPQQQIKKKESEGEDLTSKDVLELLKNMKGLPADIQVIMQSLQNFQMADKMDPLGLSSSSDIASQYMSIISKLKVAEFNESEYEEALSQLKGNGGLNELAVTSDGYLIGTNKEGDFEYFTPEEAFEGIEGYQLLTNSNLLYLRANSPEAAFNHQLTIIAQNGIGIQKVNELITDAISKLGTKSESKEGFLSTKQGDLIQGLEDFYNAIEESNGKFDGTINDLYEYKLLTKSQADQATKAISYIYNMLPTNAKSLLKVKSDGTDQGALKMIETLISSRLDSETQFDINLIGGGSKKSEKDTDQKDETKLKSSFPLNVQQSIGGVDTYTMIDRGDGIQMSVAGTQYSAIKTPNGEPIYDTSLAKMLSLSGLQGIVKDMRSIQFGDQKITPEALNNITYNNVGIIRANLPINEDGSVNLKLLEKFEQAEQEIKLSDKSPEKIKQIYEKYKLLDLLNPDGSYNLNKFAPFIITEGYTTDALSGLTSSDFVKEYKGDEDYAVSLMEKCLITGSGKNISVPDIDTHEWWKPGDWFGWTDTIFKGTIYIPITNNVNAAIYGANQNLDYDEALIQEEKYQNFEKQTKQRSTSADLLNI